MPTTQRSGVKATGIDAVYYTVGDIDGLTKFYTELLGVEPDTTWPGRLAEWSFEDDSAFGLYKTEDGSSPSIRSGSVMFAVGDIKAAIDAAKARGTTFHDGGELTDTPACLMAFGEDPEGNQFILHHRKQSGA
ncbi:MAG: VOC family protein [Candidatus Eremiobacteraeota bacterium]|nr:VOC family protein [Candidatus Eremiobacteraeota bacterium]